MAEHGWSNARVFAAGLEFWFFWKNLIAKKLKNTREKLRNFYKLYLKQNICKQFCPQNTIFPHKIVGILYIKNNTTFPNLNIWLKNIIYTFEFSGLWQKIKEKTQRFDKIRNASCRKVIQFVSLIYTVNYFCELLHKYLNAIEK